MCWSNYTLEELCLPPTARTSVGVQAEPAYVHSCVQTQGADDPTITESKSTHGSGNLAAAASLSPGTSAAIHSPSPRRYVSLKVQTDSDMWMTEAAGLAVKPVRVPMTDELTSNQASEVGRSLSPMELDSMPSSRHVSSTPTVSPKEKEAVTTSTTLHERKSLPPPSPTSSIASSSGGQDMQLSPVVSRSSSTVMKAAESVPLLSTAVASQTSNHDTTPFVGSQHIRTQRPTTSQTSSHYLRADTESQKLVMAYQQKQHTALTSVSSHSPYVPALVRYCIYRWPVIKCAWFSLSRLLYLDRRGYLPLPQALYLPRFQVIKVLNTLLETPFLTHHRSLQKTGNRIQILHSYLEFRPGYILMPLRQAAR
jgi:hypothetical protein